MRCEVTFSDWIMTVAIGILMVAIIIGVNQEERKIAIKIHGDRMEGK